jgi:hypothetical protein
MLVKKGNKKRIDRLFNNGYGIIRFKRFALTKSYSYKYLIKELLWGIAEIPVGVIINVFNVLRFLLNFIPRIYIEKDDENE